MLDTNKDLIKLIDRFILDEGFTSYGALGESEKDELVVLCINGSQEPENCISYSERIKDLLPALTRYICFKDIYSAVDIATILRKNTLIYFASDLEEIFNNRLASHEIMRYKELGLEQITDPINGETSWV